MRLLKYPMLILFCLLVILAGGFYLVLDWHMEDHDLATARLKVKADLATCGEIIDIKYPGSWLVRNGELYKGTLKINFNNDLVDHLSSLTGDTVTVFLGETQVATSVRGPNEERIGTKVSDHVAQTVLQDGQTYLGESDIAGQRNQAGYVPLRAESGNLIGMFYVGIPQTLGQGFLTRSLSTMALLGLSITLTVLVALLSWIFFRKIINYPLRKFVAGARKAATGHLGESINLSGAKEIEELKGAFNQMAEQIQVLTGEFNLGPRSNFENDSPEIEIQTVVEQMKSGPEISIVHPVDTKPKYQFGLDLDSPWYSEEEGLPKGLSKVTLGHIVQFLQITRRPLSAEEVAEGVKLTRVTVRHYLEFLELRRVLKSELKYGTGGRPVKLFILL